MVNMPKGRNTYCAKCNKHTKMKVTQYKKSAESKQAQGRRRWEQNNNKYTTEVIYAQREIADEPKVAHAQYGAKFFCVRKIKLLRPICLS